MPVNSKKPFISVHDERGFELNIPCSALVGVVTNKPNADKSEKNFTCLYLALMALFTCSGRISRRGYCGDELHHAMFYAYMFRWAHRQHIKPFQGCIMLCFMHICFDGPIADILSPFRAASYYVSCTYVSMGYTHRRHIKPFRALIHIFQP
ncbi:MAG: hypothetical protein JWQ63_4088 [Mucilaginibacter sp.]|nr:hypothetical protein [Mucilaginibacter sp.]